MAVRTIKSRGSSVTGWFPSIKLQRMVAYESRLERDYLYLLDYAPDVVSYEEQPLKIAYEHEGKTRHYTPDFQVNRRDRTEKPELIECKPVIFVETTENQRKFTVAQAWCAAQGWRFSVVTDAQIRTGWRLHNIKLLTLHARCKVTDTFWLNVTAALTNASGLPLKVLADRVIPTQPQHACQQILALVFSHKLSMALDNAPLSNNSLVSLPAHADMTENSISASVEVWS